MKTKAEKAAPAGKTEAEERLDRQGFQKIIAETNRQRGLASEYAGQAGNFVKTQAKRYGLSASIMTKTAGLARMDPSRRLGDLIALVQYAEQMGWWDPSQIDAFHDGRALFTRIAGRFQEPAAEASQEEVNTERLQGIKTLQVLTNSAAA